METNNKFKILFTAAAVIIIVAFSGCSTNNDAGIKQQGKVTEQPQGNTLQYQHNRSGNFNAAGPGEGFNRTNFNRSNFNRTNFNRTNMTFPERYNRSVNDTGNFTGNFTRPGRGSV